MKHDGVRRKYAPNCKRAAIQSIIFAACGGSMFQINARRCGMRLAADTLGIWSLPHAAAACVKKKYAPALITTPLQFLLKQEQ